MKKEKVCDVCEQKMNDNIRWYKIKKRYVIEDNDGFWHADGHVYICWNCLQKIKESMQKPHN